VQDTSHLHSFVGGICPCGQHDTAQGFSAEAVVSGQIETALVHGLFPDRVLRRTLLKAVGASVLLGALSSIVPVDTLKAIAQERKPLEKTKLNVGFLPITCATPLIYGEKLGSYAKE
jgi:nitrate/nitrite transport system substrate-binding protein